MAKRSTKAIVHELNALHERIGLKSFFEITEGGEVIALGAGWHSVFAANTLDAALAYIRKVAADPDASQITVRAETTASVDTLCLLVDQYGPKTIERWTRRAAQGLNAHDILAVDALNASREVEHRVVH